LSVRTNTVVGISTASSKGDARLFITDKFDALTCSKIAARARTTEARKGHLGLVRRRRIFISPKASNLQYKHKQNTEAGFQKGKRLSCWTLLAMLDITSKLWGEKQYTIHYS